MVELSFSLVELERTDILPSTYVFASLHIIRLSLCNPLILCVLQEPGLCLLPVN